MKRIEPTTRTDWIPTKELKPTRFDLPIMIGAWFHGNDDADGWGWDTEIIRRHDDFKDLTVDFGRRPATHWCRIHVKLPLPPHP